MTLDTSLSFIMGGITFLLGMAAQLFIVVGFFMRLERRIATLEAHISHLLTAIPKRATDAMNIRDES